MRLNFFRMIKSEWKHPNMSRKSGVYLSIFLLFDIVLSSPFRSSKRLCRLFAQWNTLDLSYFSKAVGCSNETRLDEREKKNLFTLKRVHPIDSYSSLEDAHVLYLPEMNLLLIIASLLRLNVCGCCFLVVDFLRFASLMSTIIVIMPDAFFNKNIFRRATARTMTEIATWQKRLQIRIERKSFFFFNYLLFLPNTNMNNRSAENEQKPKRRTSIIRFGNRCRQILASTKQNNILRSACFFVFVFFLLIKFFSHRLSSLIINFIFLYLSKYLEKISGDYFQSID